MKYKVTVVIPVYNTEKYLEECVTSVTNQTLQGIEILLVNDGSTDGSAALCDKLAACDKRIRVINKENGGAASARNLGIDEAAGEYIMFLDSDDWLDIDAVETLVEKADSQATDVLRFNYVREFNGKSLVKQNTFLEERVYVGDECSTVCRQVLGLTGKELEHLENMNFLASSCVCLYRSSFIKDLDVRFVSLQEIGSFEDGYFNFCVFVHMNRFSFIDRPFYHYRKNNGSSYTANYRKNYFERQCVLFSLLRNKIEQEEKWDYFSEAYRNRVVLSTMEICFNAMCNKASFLARYREIRGVLKHEYCREFYKSFDISPMSLKWKVYFFFITHSMVLPTYVITKLIIMLKNRGTK